MSPRPRLHHGWVVVGVALFALGACVAFAGTPDAGANKPAAATTPAAKSATPLPSLAAPVHSLGLMAFLDPETGLLTGSIVPMLPLMDQRTANVLLEQVPTPGGGWMIDLKGTGLEYYVLHVDALGNRRATCVQDLRRAAPAPPAPAQPRAEER